MKKIFAWMLSLCLMMSAFGAFAEESANVLNWSDVESQLADAGWEGDFVAFDEISVMVWVPTAMGEVELTDEDKESGYIGYYQNEDGTAIMSVMYVDANGTSLEDYATMLADNGMTDIDSATINGLPVVTYKMAENDMGVIALATEAGYILEFGFSPISDESFNAVATVMMASIQATEAGEAEEEVEESEETEEAEEGEETEAE